MIYIKNEEEINKMQEACHIVALCHIAIGENIKVGMSNVVLATKAFGMGIDVPDITNVYHFAPTGNLADYVQEIGRAARKPELTGIASTDFYREDFRYIKIGRGNHCSKGR